MNNITPSMIIKSMDETQRHELALICATNNIEPIELLQSVSTALNIAFALTVRVVNTYLETPEGKKYLENTNKINKLGGFNNG